MIRGGLPGPMYSLVVQHTSPLNSSISWGRNTFVILRDFEDSSHILHYRGPSTPNVSGTLKFVDFVLPFIFQRRIFFFLFVVT